MGRLLPDADRSLAPRDTSISHSFAELELKRARQSTGALEQEHHMRAAGSIAKSLTGKNATTAHGYVTIAKIGLSKLNAWSKNGIQDDVVFRSYVKEITEAIQGGLQHFPDDPYLRVAEAQLSDFIEQDAKAIESLRRAFCRMKLVRL